MTRCAAIQYCAGADWRENQRQLAPLLKQAKGAELVLLPENCLCYGGDYRQLADNIEPVLTWLSAQAQELGAWLVAGSVPLASRADGGQVAAPRVRAAQLVFAPSGQLTARYDKLHLFDVDVADAQGSYRESAVFEPGDKLVTTRIAGITTGLAICYDLRFAALALFLAQRGASLLIYPSAFTQLTGAAHWELLLRSRAVETGSYVLAANLCGQHTPKRASFGHSMLVDPWGDVVARLGAEPGVLLADYDADFVHTTRQRLPLLNHQRLMLEPGDDIRFEEQF